MIGLKDSATDWVVGEAVSPARDLVLEPYRFVWLAESDQPFDSSHSFIGFKK